MLVAMELNALFLNCTLKKSPEVSNTEGLIDMVRAHFDELDVKSEVVRPVDTSAKAESDLILRELQSIMFAYNIGILKRADRLEQARVAVEALVDKFNALAAPHTHELVRLKETEAMLLAARFILGASLVRTESRLSHFREDYEARDDENWLVWVDITERGREPEFSRTPIPTPLCSARLVTRRPTRLEARHAQVSPV